MKIKINIILFFLLSLVILSCEEEDEFSGPYYLTIMGSDEVEPTSTETYSLGDLNNPESYTWTVEGPAEIVGTNKGLMVSVKFNTVGDVVLTVTNGKETGKLSITSAEVAPTVTASFSKFGTGYLRMGQKDTVLLTFAAPLASAPNFMSNTDSSGFFGKKIAFVSGSMGPLVKKSDNEYYAIYTAGSGNGTPEGAITNLKASDVYGGISFPADTILYVKLPVVDNIAPIANLTYGSEVVKDSTVITITATFSEGVINLDRGKSPEIQLSGPGVKTKIVQLDSTADQLVYTYQDTLFSQGNGNLNVAVMNVTDLAGNNVAVVNNSSSVRIDNMGPVFTGLASDSGDYATFQITSSEGGSGYYLILEDKADAPASAEEFLELGGVEVSLNPSTNSRSAVQLLAKGNYDVYFLSKDEAGNFGSISEGQDLSMN